MTRRSHKLRHASRGSILVVVLFIMVVLSFASLSAAYRAGLRTRMVRQRAIASQLHFQASSAVAVALGRLTADANDFDHFAEIWAAHPPLASDHWLAAWSADEPEYAADYHVIDEQSKLHVLNASSAALERLGMTTGQMAAVFDWMDDDEAMRSEGAESEFYLAQSSPYRAKNAPIEILEEMLLLRGVTVADFMGEDGNHNRELDSNENDGEFSWPPDDADGTLKLGWVDLLTTFGDGRINLNTAPRAVLRTLPISDQAVDQIVAFRRYDGGSAGALEDHVFRSETDIDQLQGLTEIERETLKVMGAYRSTHYRIFAEVTHRATGLRCRLQVVVNKTQEGPQILQWKVVQ